MIEYQTHMWYVDFLNIWITSDKTLSLHVWDIEKEDIQFSLTSPKIGDSIIDLIPLEILKLVAISSLNKVITFWDFRRKSIVLELDLTQGGIHSMSWSNDYQILITAGYQNKINLWSVNPVYLDVTLVGELIGHTAMVTAAVNIEKTPMILSADDAGRLKVWDIRNLRCMQSVELGPKNSINKLLDLCLFDKLCFVGSRLNLVSFDKPIENVKNVKQEEQVWPVRVEYNFSLNEIIVCTRKDLRFVDMQTGRVKKVYKGLLEADNDEITAFGLVQQDKKFILGDHRGQLNLYSYATGEKLNQLAPHNNEITGVRIDLTNKMVVSSSWDSSISIQKETELGYELKRTLKNIHYNKEISLMEISVYHNIFITTSNTNIIYVWDYEFMKMIATIEILENAEPTCITFIHGYSYLIIADSSGKIHFLHFAKKIGSSLSFRRVSCLDITQNPFSTDSHKDHSSHCFITRMVVDSSETKNMNNQEEIRLYTSSNKGDIRVYDLHPLLKLNFVQVIPHANVSVNYNSDRTVHEDFQKQIKLYKVDNYVLKEDTLSTQQMGISKKTSESVSLGKYMTNQFNAHKDSLTTLLVLITPQKRLMTSSLDGYLKIWTMGGDQMAVLNINHPLPTFWNITQDETSRYKKKILYALKLLGSIYKRYDSKLLIEEQKKMSINRFLKGLALTKIDFNGKRESIGLEGSKSHRLNGEKEPKVLLMKDEYSPRDLQYDKAKKIYQRELQGPSLRQMDVAQRLSEAQKAWRQEKIIEDEQNTEDKHTRESDENKDRNEFMNLLLGDSNRAFLNEPAYSKYTKHLAKKLEVISTAGMLARRKRKESTASIKLRNTVQKINLTNTNKNLNGPSKLNDKGYEPGESNFPINQTHINEHTEGSFFKERHRSSERKLVFHSIKLNETETPRKEHPSNKLQNKTEVKSANRVDFLEYAAQKLTPRELNSFSAKELLAEPQSSQYKRKIQRQGFNAILQDLDYTVKKSQTRNANSKNLGLKLLDTSRITSNDKSSFFTQIPAPYSAKASSNSNGRLNSDPEDSSLNKEDYYMPRQITNGRIMSQDLPPVKKSIFNFSAQLNQLKETFEESWHLKLNETERQQRYLEEFDVQKQLRERASFAGAEKSSPRNANKKNDKDKKTTSKQFKDVWKESDSINLPAVSSATSARDKDAGDVYGFKIRNNISNSKFAQN